MKIVFSLHEKNVIKQFKYKYFHRKILLYCEKAENEAKFVFTTEACFI